MPKDIAVLDGLLQGLADLRKRYAGLRGKMMAMRREAGERKSQALIGQLRQKIDKM